MTSPHLYFRPLNEGDIPAVIELTKTIWDGHDYMSRVIELWMEESNDAYLFGAFDDEATTNLVAMGRIRWLTRDVAWMEGARVHPDYQKTGIGAALYAHGIEYAANAGASVARYDTGMRNVGSIALAKRYGFTEIFRLHSVHLKRDDFTSEMFSADSDAMASEITPEEALERYRTIENPPIDMLCIGFAFVPMEIDQVSNGHWSFVALDGAVATVLHYDPSANIETPPPDERWLVIHGSPEAIKRLAIACTVKAFEDPAVEMVNVFIPEDAIETLMDSGFRLEDIISGVVLFEKKLR
jgi:GNAT superfamily N-acetyltransferase